MDKTTWQRVMDCKSADKRHRGVANTLTRDELDTILATVDFFSGNVRQVAFDLQVARYRVFDALAMYVGGRLDEPATKVLVYSFLKVDGDIDKWIEDLRETDYQMDESWSELVLNEE